MENRYMGSIQQQPKSEFLEGLFGHPIHFRYMQTATIRLDYLVGELSDMACTAMNNSTQKKDSHFPAAEYVYEDLINPLTHPGYRKDLNLLIRQLRIIPPDSYGLIIRHGFMAVSSHFMSENVWSSISDAVGIPGIPKTLGEPTKPSDDPESIWAKWEKWELWISYEACTRIKNYLGTFEVSDLNLELYWQVIMDVMIHMHPAHFQFRGDVNYVNSLLGETDDRQQNPPASTAGTD